jgi:hypothetical protein
MGALRRLCLPTFVVAIAAAWLAWRGWTELSDFGPFRAIRSEQLELAGPAVVGFVLDLTYLLAYALLVVPLIALTGSGFAGELGRAAPGLVLPRVTAVPHWLFIAAAVIAIDAAGLAGRPVPVEQEATRPRLARIFLTPWAQPFTTSKAES